MVAPVVTIGGMRSESTVGASVGKLPLTGDAEA
jgi:hypothetical protein